MRVFIPILSILLFTPSSWAKVINYNINIEYKTLNITGKSVQVIALGKVGEPTNVPAPILEFTEGDIARITFQNHLKEETSIHWHGLLVPNDQDGVPHITTPPIMPGQTFTYEFPIRQSGTYWYHSHTDLQEQRGVYGAIVIHPKHETLKYDAEQVLVLSDWTDRDPEAIMHNLKTDAEWEQIRKNTNRGWYDDFKNGTLKARIQSEWERMGPMDVADVSYDAFLINGFKNNLFPNLIGKKVRFRIINASSSSYFHIRFGQSQMQIVAADGLNVSPVNVNEILIAMAETYDVIVNIPQNKSIEFKATSQDVTGSTSAILGSGPLEKALDIAKPDPYSMGGMRMSDNCEPGEPGCENPYIKLSYDFLRSPTPTTLPKQNPTIEYQFHLTGNMLRYSWSFDNKVLSDADVVVVKKGQNVRFKLINDTMMHHPLHLHGHFFRVVNAQGDFSPLKHTVDIAPMQTRVIEFYADEEKDWVFHCHNLYHMGSGMTRIIHYQDPSSASHLNHNNMNKMSDMSGTQWYPSAEGTMTNQKSELHLKTTNSKYDGELHGEYGNKDKEYKVRAEVNKNITPYFDVYVGDQVDNDGNAYSLGVKYKLPLLIDSRLGYGNRGTDYSLSKEFSIVNQWSLETKYGREYGHKEYFYLIRYRFNRNFSFQFGRSEKGAELGVQIKH